MDRFDLFREALGRRDLADTTRDGDGVRMADGYRTLDILDAVREAYPARQAPIPPVTPAEEAMRADRDRVYAGVRDETPLGHELDGDATEDGL